MRSYLLTQMISPKSVKKKKNLLRTTAQSEQRWNQGRDEGDQNGPGGNGQGGWEESASLMTQKGQAGFQRRLLHFTVRNLR